MRSGFALGAGARCTTAWEATVQRVRFNMRNHDLVSDGFLTLTAAGFVLLSSSLVAIAFN
jgi:hypothetical protein